LHEAALRDDTNNRRRFLRHPAGVRVCCRRVDEQTPERQEMLNVSHGGMAFVSRDRYERGVLLLVECPALRRLPGLKGQVVWCRELAGRTETKYATGLRFLDEQTFQRARMVEQICHIESYRSTQREQFGRTLSSNEAALEWVTKFADRFPA
jgi:hypothetical protein